MSVWSFGGLLIAASILLAWLVLGPGPRFESIALERGALCLVLLTALWLGRHAFDSWTFRAAAAAVIAGLIVFNLNIVNFGAATWSGMTMLVVLELFVIGITFAPYRTSVVLSCMALLLSHVIAGLAGHAPNPTVLFAGLMVAGMATIAVLLLSFQTSRLERENFSHTMRLREQQRALQRFAEIVEKTSSHVIVLDAELFIRWVNPSFAATVDQDVDALVGRSAVELFGDRAQLENPQVSRLLTQPITEPIRLRHTLPKPGGESVVIDWDVHPNLDDSGQVESYNVIGTDITTVMRQLDRQAHEAAQNQTLKRVMELALTDLSTREFLEEVLSLLLGNTPWLHSENQGAVFLRQGRTDCLGLAASQGLDNDVLRMCGRNDLSDCTCGIAAAEQRMLFDSAAAERHRTSLGFSDTSSVYNVPMVYDGRVEGVLVVFMDAAHELAEAEVDFLERLAAAIAVGVVNRAHQAEKAAKSQELTSFFDLTLDLLGIADMQARPIKLNRAWERFLGDRFEQVMNSSFAEFLHADDLDRALSEFEALRRGEKVEGLIARFDAGDRGWRRLEWRATPTSDGVYYFSARDITEREAMLDNLMLNNQRLAEISQLSGVGGWHWDVEHGTFSWDDQLRRIYELDDDETPAAAGIMEYTVPEHRELLTAALRDTLKSRQGWDLEHQIVTARGNRIWIRSVASPVHHDGRVTAVSGSVQNIDARKQHEQAMEAARLAAELSNAAKTDFLANMSHEIRTPITGIIGMLDIHMDSELSADQRDCVEEARGAANSLLGILNDILDYTKLEAGALETEYVAFDFADIVSQVRALFQHRADENGIELLFRIAPMPTTLMSDPGRIRQVLINLVGNALKFTEKGQVRMLCEWQPDLDASADGNPCGELRVTVADTGVGIPQEILPRLFSRFSQADNSMTRKYGGTGLGLAISKQIIGQLGGEIGVESVEGRGSSFWFSVPCGVREVAPGSETRKTDAGSPAVDADMEARPQLNLLVAEDNPVNQKIVSAFLKKGGHAFTITDNGVDAVDAVRNGEFDLVLMDIQMPRLDGMEATRQIRELPPPSCDIPIVALTANAMVGDRERYMAVGMDAYVPKPINRELLLQTIDETYESRCRNARGTVELFEVPRSDIA